MPITIYNDGSKYGDADAYYGRVSVDVYVAQELQTRETGLKVSIIDERINRWTQLVSGQELLEKNYVEPGPTTLGYKYYRGEASAIQLDGGNIIRVRVGSSTLSDRQIYTQTITDPTNAAQWASWSLLYSGSHVAVGIAKTGASTYDVYNSRLADGKVYKNNSTVAWDPTGISGVKGVIEIFPVVGNTTRAMFLTVLLLDTTFGDNRRHMDVYYTGNIDSTAPAYDLMNFRWATTDAFGYQKSDGKLFKLQSIGLLSDARSFARGGSIATQTFPDTSFVANRRPTEFQIVRGIGSDWGITQIGRPRLYGPFSDGYYYLFSYEHRADSDSSAITNQYIPILWQRSKDLTHWSEATYTGIQGGLQARLAFESGGYIYLVGNGDVWRRPSTGVTYDFSNYATRAAMEIPRENQEGSGTVVIANPSGVNNSLVSLGDRRIKIEAGIKTATGQFEFMQLNDWWVKNVNRVVEGEANRLEIAIGDIWQRLSNPLRDTINFVGRTDWLDFAAGRRNEVFNYYFVSDAAPTYNTTDFSLTAAGIVLYTGWKGHNARVKATFSSIGNTPGIIFRYVDVDNYMRVQRTNSTTIALIERKAGVETTWATAGVAALSTFSLEVDVVYGHYVVKYNGTQIMNATRSNPAPKVLQSGYSGFYGNAVSNLCTYKDFQLFDWEVDLTLQDLIKSALAMGDYHDPIVGAAEGKAYAIMWGPQTDIPTVADGLRQALISGKLELVWRDGKIEVGRFTDNSTVKTIQNRIIESAHVEDPTRRINLSVVDGNEHSWIELDTTEIQNRDRQITGYFDLPELLEFGQVKARAQEEIRRGKLGGAPGGSVVMFFDLWRMDAVQWIDNVGNSNKVRVEGMTVEIEQGKEPKQLQTLDTSLIE